MKIADCFKKNKDKSLRILTITSTFPSLIQPWLINQLVGIAKNNNENLIVARQSDSGPFSSDILKHNLSDRTVYITDKFTQLILFQIKCLITFKGLIATIRGFSRAIKLLTDKELTTKEKIYSFFILPHLGNESIDIVHSHSEMACNKFIAIIKALKAPLVITFHGLPPVGVNPITIKQRRRLSNLANLVLVNTEFAKQQYISLGGDPKKIHILPQGTNLSRFPFDPKPFPTESSINIISVGRFHPDKGQKYLIFAVRTLINEGFDIKLSLVGNGPDRKKLERLTEKLHLNDRIKFYSKITDEKLQQLYKQSHIFVLASVKSKDGFHEETQGVVLQEAQASGLLTVATRVGGIPECIQDNISGFLIEERSYKSIHNKIKELIKRKDEWSSIQDAARSWVESRYDINTISKKINDLYANLLGSSK